MAPTRFCRDVVSDTLLCRRLLRVCVVTNFDVAAVMLDCTSLPTAQLHRHYPVL